MAALKYWSPELLDCFRGAMDLFPLDFLDTPAADMPADILKHVEEMGHEYSQADRLRLKVTAIRIAALVKGGGR